MTEEILDRDGQIVDAAWAKDRIGKWYRDLGNVRQMHSATYPPAGRADELFWSKAGLPVLTSKVYEPTAIKLLDQGVYRGYSLGIFDPCIYDDPKAPNGRIGKASPDDTGWIGEISLVDVPSCPTSLFSLVKRAAPDARPKRVDRVQVVASTGRVVTLRKGASAALAKILDRSAASPLPRPTLVSRRNPMTDIDTSRVSDDLTRALDGASLAGRVAGAAVSAAVTKSLSSPLFKDDGDPDDEVDDGISDLLDDLGDIAGAQADDTAGGDGKPTDDEVDDAISAVESAAVDLVGAQAADQAADDVMKGMRKCKACGGTGAISDVKCAKCGGEGMIPKKVKAAKAADDTDGGGGGRDDSNPPDKGKPCSTCGGEGKIMDGNRTCPDCNGSGKAKAKKGAKVKKGKKLGPKKNGKLKPAPNPDLPDKIPGDAPPPASTMGKKRMKAAARVHDMLCPSFDLATARAAHPGVETLGLADVINPTFFSDRLKALTDGTAKVRTSSVGEAYMAAAAAEKVASMSLPDFETLRASATKSFTDAYPSVSLSPGLIRPEDFHRGFLPSANSETSSTTTVPTPDLKPPLDAGQFDRGPLTDNETRPSLTGGDSVAGGKAAKPKKAKRGRVSKGDTAIPTPVPSRLFYRNADKSEWASAMTILHDHIAHHFPGTCPMLAVQPGTEIDSDGLMGSPAEMNAAGPDMPTLVSPIPADHAGMLAPAKAAEADRGPLNGQIDEASLKALITSQVKRQVKGVQRSERKKRKALQAKLTKAKGELRRPNPRYAAKTRGAGNFASSTDPAALLKASQARARVTDLRSRMTDRDSTVAGRAVETLREELSPAEFAAALVE